MPSHSPPETGDADFGVEDLFIDTPDGKIFARVWGDRRTLGEHAPVVLLHDSLGSVELWRDFPSRLAKILNRCVIAYDRIGYGKSDPCSGLLPSDFIHRQAHSEFAVLRSRLEIGRMILFGHSVGGGMAVAAGAAFPEATKAIITEAAQAYVDDDILAGVRKAETAFQAPGQIDRLERYHGDKARWALDAWTKTWASPEFADWSLDADLRALLCPVLAIHGDRDEYGANNHPERIAEFAPTGSKALILADCGHVPHREKPAAVLNVVRDFIEQLPDHA